MLSVSIVTYKSDSDILERLLDSLKSERELLPPGYTLDRIYIIDNSNTDLSQIPSLRSVLVALQNVTLIPNSKNIGYGAAHNIAIDASRSRYHLILNPDVIIGEGCLVSGLERMESDEKVVAMSPAAVNENNEKLYLTKNYPSLFNLFLRALPSAFGARYFSTSLADYENREIVDNNQAANVKIISGCFMLCRREALLSAGKFDERYFLYFEDFALSLELGKIGNLAFNPAMKIIHYGGHASRKGMKHLMYFAVSGIRFFNQYGWKPF